MRRGLAAAHLGGGAPAAGSIAGSISGKEREAEGGKSKAAGKARSTKGVLRAIGIAALVLVNAGLVFVGTGVVVARRAPERVPKRLAALARRGGLFRTTTTTEATTTTTTTTTTTEPMAFWSQGRNAENLHDDSDSAADEPPPTEEPHETEDVHRPHLNKPQPKFGKVAAKLAKVRAKIASARVHIVHHHGSAGQDAGAQDDHTNIDPLAPSSHAHSESAGPCEEAANAVNVAMLLDGPDWYTAAAGAAYSYLYNTKHPARLRFYFVVPHESWADSGVGGHLMCHEANKYTERFPDVACVAPEFSRLRRHQRRLHRRHLHQGADLLLGDGDSDGGGGGGGDAGALPVDGFDADVSEDVGVAMPEADDAEQEAQEAQQGIGNDATSDGGAPWAASSSSSPGPAAAVIPCSSKSRLFNVVPFDASKFPTLRTYPEAGRQGRVALLYLPDLLGQLGVEDVLVVPTASVAQLDVVAGYEQHFPKRTGLQERAVTRSDQGNCGETNAAWFSFDEPAVASLARDVPTCLSPDACLSDVGVLRLHLPTFAESSARREAEELARRAWMAAAEAGDGGGTLWRRVPGDYGVDVERALVLALCRAEADGASDSSSVSSEDTLVVAASRSKPASFAGPATLPRTLDVVLYHVGADGAPQTRVPRDATVLRWPGPPWPWEANSRAAFVTHFDKYQLAAVARV